MRIHLEPLRVAGADPEVPAALELPLFTAADWAAAGMGLTRLFTEWLGRCGLETGGTETEGEDAAVIARLGGSIVTGPQWSAVLQLRLRGNEEQAIRDAAEADEAYHLLYRLLETVVRACDRTVPVATIHAFEDYRTASAAALLFHLAAIGQDDAESRQRVALRAFELDPRLAAARAALAAGALARGQTEAAAGLLHGCALGDSERARDLGLDLWNAGAAETAAELLGAAVAANSEDGLAHAALASLLAARGETQEAVWLATRATELLPADYRGWAALADAHRLAGEDDRASFYYNLALRLNPSPAGVVNVLKGAAASRLRAGHAAEARALIHRAIAAAPEDPENYGNLALAERALGNHAAARAAAEGACAHAGGDDRFAALAAEFAAGAVEEP